MKQSACLDRSSLQQTFVQSDSVGHGVLIRKLNIRKPATQRKQSRKEDETKVKDCSHAGQGYVEETKVMKR